jgi:hypothetical protein
VIGIYVLKEAKKFNELLKKQREIIYDIMQSLKLEQKIKEDADKLNQEENQSDNQSAFDPGNLSEFFGENNLIIQMAVEIGKELDLPTEKMTDPMQAIRFLIGQDGSKLQEILSKVCQKLKEKIQNEGINEEQLVNDAKRMNEKIVEKFKNIPGMPDIEKFSQKIAEQFSKEFEEKNTDSPSSQNHNNIIPTIEQLTATMNENLNQMGLDNLEQFQKNFSEIIEEINRFETIDTNQILTNSNECCIKDNSQQSPFFDSQTDIELQKELDNIKDNIDK